MINKSYDDNNIFAKIIRKEAKAEVVFENQHVLCFNDIFPKAPVHVLIIPKAKFKDILDFSKNASTDQKNAIYVGIENIITKFNINSNGCRIITNHGKNGRQEVPHLHFHLLGGRDLGSMLT